jgi:HEPN domain-containing protein
MRIEPNDYWEAAQDRLTDARRLYAERRYSFSLYAAGLAVESLLRAYRVRQSSEFDERHDLLLLLNGSGIEEVVASAEYVEISAAVSLIFRCWKNDIRFASEDRMKRHLKKLRLDRGIRGNFVKENCRISIDAATKIINIGVMRWPHR